MLRRHATSLIAVVLPVALAACGSGSTAPDPRTEPPLVRTAVAEAATSGSQSFSGVVAARVQSDLGFRVPGKVVERLVDTGQAVRRGQPLMRIDPIDLGLQANAAREAVAAAKARARQAVDDEARYRGLVAEGAVSASTYAQIKAAADAASAQLAAAEAQADVAKNATGYSVLVADTDGIVVDTLVEPGQVVNAGQTVVKLARAGQREAVVQLPETLRPEIGSSARVKLYGSAEGATAKLRQLSNAADRLTRTFEARYVLEGSAASAPLGVTVAVEIAHGRAQGQAIRVPLAAVFDPGQGPGVWVVEGSPATVKWRTVELLSVSDEDAKVQGNLKVGERIVSLGAQLLHPGDAVRVAGAATVATGSKP
ncbi:MAG: efflux RND transporter periplasmic adaptor subunit [Burkholderiales bacterium]|nr:MAG: efflux RND transporter periplasmic adaptor subunit [Burkholderiales bacterium]